MTACSIADMTLKEYKAKAIELFGEEKAEELENAIVKKRLTDAAKDKKLLGDDGEVNEADLVEPGKLLPSPCDPIWFFEIYSGHIFKCPMRDVETAITECNARLYSENFVSINDFYWELGMKNINMGEMGEAFGWRVEDAPIRIKTKPYELDGVPCYALMFSTEPKNLHY